MRSDCGSFPGLTAVEVDGADQLQVRVHAADAVDVTAVLEARPHRRLVQVLRLTLHPDDEEHSHKQRRQLGDVLCETVELVLEDDGLPLVHDVVPDPQVSVGRLGRTALKELGDGLFLVVRDALHVQKDLLLRGVQLLLLLLLLLLLGFLCSVSWTLANPVVTAF